MMKLDLGGTIDIINQIEAHLRQTKCTLDSPPGTQTIRDSCA